MSERELQAIHDRLCAEIAVLRGELERLSRVRATPRGFQHGLLAGALILATMMATAAVVPQLYIVYAIYSP